MTVPALPENETQRLEALRRYQILDTLPEEDFDDIVRLAAQICDVPISVFSLVDYHRQWFKAKHGLNITETPRELAFCAHALLGESPFIVPDALADERFWDHPMVTHPPNIRFYAGIPLLTPDHYRLGTLCVLDQKPRQLTDNQLFGLKTLARQIVHLLEMRLQHQNLRKQLQYSEQQQNQLAQANQLKNKLFAVIAHDLQSPLANIQTFLSVWTSGKLSPEKTQLLIKNMRQTLLMTDQMLKNLLHWSVSQMSATESMVQDVVIMPLVEETLAGLQMAAESKGNTLQHDIVADLTLQTDPGLMRLILHNLVHNAIKFTEQGCIRVTADLEQGQLALHVIDTGQGLSPENQARLFQWDTAGSVPGTAQEKGSGIGLLLCQDFARQLGGKITVQSQLGAGSTFTLWLPIHS